MLNALRRVISDVSASDQPQPAEESAAAAQENDPQRNIIPMDDTTSLVSTSAGGAKPLSAVDAAAMDTQSSLSDGSIPELHDAKDMFSDSNNEEAHSRNAPQQTPPFRQQQQQDQHQQQQQQNPQLHQFARMDSQSQGDGSSESQTRGGSQTSSRDWGWFEDVHISDVGMVNASLPSKHNSHHPNSHKQHTKKDTAAKPEPNREAAAMAVTAPTYVLEESLSSQRLWKDTAGNRPPQPVEERAFYEKMWAQNFARSQVNYKMPPEVLTAASPISLNPWEGGFDATATQNTKEDYNQYAPSNNHNHNKHYSHATKGDMFVDVDDIPGESLPHPELQQEIQKVPGSKSDGDLTVLLRGPNAFGTTVSKSFAREDNNTIVGVDTVNISIAGYRVVESKKYGKYAQFLVIYREGSIRDTVGIWKRYRDFEELSHKVTQAHEGCAAVIANISPLAITEEPEIEHLPNAITSWRLLKKRKRWYRCLDAGYLSLKVFLLERFLHDILFESSSPKLLRDFVLGPASRDDSSTGSE